MTIQCDHIIEARRPDIVVVEKDSNKAIIVDIASPWDHRVYEKESEKVEKDQDLKREIRKLWGTRRVEVILVVVDALSAVSKRLNTWLDNLGITINMGLLQKTALLGTARILGKVLESWKRRTNPRDLWPLAMACSLGVMLIQQHSPAKAFHLE